MIEQTSADKIGVRITIGSSTITQTSTLGAAGTQLLTLGPFAYTSAGENLLSIELQDVASKPTRRMSLNGLCVYFDI